MENKNEMPIGLAFQMSMNEKAMENFAGMTEQEKRQVIEAARNVNSKDEMNGIVEDLAELK